MKMQRRKFLKVGAAALGGVLLGRSQAQAQTLRFANFFPAPAGQSRLIDEFAADVRRVTEGRVNVEHFPGGTLLGPADIFEGVARGIAQLGLSNLGYTPGRFIETEMLDLPLGFPNAWVANKVAQEFFERYRPREWNDVVVIALHTSPVNVIMTAEKPVRRLEDLRGLTLRGTGYVAQFVEALGARARPIPAGEFYDSLARRVIDGLMIPYETAATFRLAEVARYVTEAWPLGQVYTFYIVANRRAWEALPTEARSAIERYVTAEFRDKLTQMWNTIDINGYRSVVNARRQIIELPVDEIRRWQEVAARVIQRYIDAMVARGYSEAALRERLGFIRQRIAFWLSEQRRLGVQSSTGPSGVRIRL